jgi:hypothetical protein
MEPGGSRRSQKDSEGDRRSQKEPEGSRRSQKVTGGNQEKLKGARKDLRPRLLVNTIPDEKGSSPGKRTWMQWSGVGGMADRRGRRPRLLFKTTPGGRGAGPGKRNWMLRSGQTGLSAPSAFQNNSWREGSRPSWVLGAGLGSGCTVYGQGFGLRIRTGFRT